MKILLDLPLSKGGVARYGLELVEGLRRSDPTLQISLVQRPTMGVDRAFTPWGRGWVGLRAAATGQRLIHGLHFELPPTRLPAVVTVPDLIPLEFPASMPNPLYRGLFERILRRSIKRADAVIVPSERTKETMTAYAISTEDVTVIPHGVSRAFSPLQPVDRMRARARFAEGLPYVACISSFKAHKNLAVIPRVADLVSDDNLRVVVAGHHGIPQGSTNETLRLLGRLDDADLRDFLAGAETLLIPSHVEGFGLPALEALACGTPVVCGPGLGALPYLREALVEVDVSDPGAIAIAIRRLVETPLRARLSDEGLAIAERMSIQKMCGRTLDVYLKVLG